LQEIRESRQEPNTTHLLGWYFGFHSKRMKSHWKAKKKKKKITLVFSEE
jgi:hypothetical protein